jgi:hypothetical protein
LTSPAFNGIDSIDRQFRAIRVELRGVLGKSK